MRTVVACKGAAMAETIPNRLSLTITRCSGGLCGHYQHRFQSLGEVRAPGTSSQPVLAPVQTGHQTRSSIILRTLRNTSVRRRDLVRSAPRSA